MHVKLLKKGFAQERVTEPPPIHISSDTQYNSYTITVSASILAYISDCTQYEYSAAAACLQGDTYGHGKGTVDIFVACSAGWWAAPAAALLPHW